MRLIKMFGLAAIAAVMAMAFVGASSASAANTALCKEDAVNLTNEACPANKLISHVHAVSVNASGVAGLSAKLLTSIINVECEALFLGDVTTAGLLGTGVPLALTGKFTYPTCSGGCEAKEVSEGASVSVTKTASEEAAVTGSAEILVKCGSLIHCVYNGTNLTGLGKGGLKTGTTFGEMGHITFSESVVNKVSGTLCPSTAKLDALFLLLGEKGYIAS